MPSGTGTVSSSTEAYDHVERLDPVDQHDQVVAAVSTVDPAQKLSVPAGRSHGIAPRCSENRRRRRTQARRPAVFVT